MTMAPYDARLLRYLADQQQQLAAYAPGMGYRDGAGQVQRPRVQPGPQLWTPSRGRGHGIVVAAYDTSPYERESADVICDGVDDQEQITEALNKTTSEAFATVHLTSGSFVVSAAVEVPLGGELTCGSQGVATIYTQDCDAVHVDRNATIRNLGFANGFGVDEWSATATGIRSTTSDFYNWWTGVIENCLFFYFGTDIYLYNGDWLIDRCAFWNYGGAAQVAAFDAWMLKIADDGAHANNGKFFVRDCRMNWGQGIYANGGPNTELHVSGCDLVAESSLTTPVSVQHETGYAVLDGNVWLGGSVLLNSDKGRALDSQVDQLYVAGDNYELRGIHAGHLEVLAGATNNRLWGNPTAVIDGGTGTILNLDGSANDWNF